MNISYETSRLRDAMLARLCCRLDMFIRPSIRLSVRLSQAGIVSKRLDGSRCFGVVASFDLSYTVL